MSPHGADILTHTCAEAYIHTLMYTVRNTSITRVGILHLILLDPC